jgi:hypothetical protein
VSLTCALAALLLAGAYAPHADAAIYWPNQETQTIGGANNDGSGVDNSVVDVSGATNGACSVAVGPGYVYWTGGSGAGYVGRASRSTGEPEDTFITTASDLPCGVAVDSAHVYWNNYSLPGIGRANLDGTGIDQDFINTGVNPQHPSVDGEHIFWSNKGFNCSNPPPSGCTIGRADIDGADASENQSFITGTAEPPSGTATDGTYVYWGEGFDTIGRHNADGTGVPDHDFIENTDACAVAVYGSHIYWARYGGFSGGFIARANLDGTGVDEEFIKTAGGTCGVAVDGLPFTSPPKPPTPPVTPPPLNCPYGNPACASTCTNPATLLATCADLAGPPGLCAPGRELFPQCLHPVVPQTQCRRTGGLVECTQTTPGGREAIGSCASIGPALPECNVPRREVPVACHAGEFNLDPLPGQVCFGGAPVPITNCPPPSPAVSPACVFSTTVTAPNAPRGAQAAARRKARGRTVSVTIGCPKVLAKPRCTGTIAVDGLRTSLLRTLAKQAEYSSGTYRHFVPGLAGFAATFQKSADAIAKRVLGGRKLPKAVNTAAIVAELGRSDPQTIAYAASLQRAVREYRRLAGKAKKRRRAKRSDAQASRGTTTLKRFSLKSGRKRARIRVRLSAAAVRRLRRDAAKRGRVPVRVIVSFKANPRPVVRFVDLGLRVR